MNLRIFQIPTIFFLLTSCLNAQHTAQQALKEFLSAPEFAHASISIQVTDLLSKSTIISHNQDLALPSASTAKLFATASAIELLGTDFQPETNIFMDGSLNSGILNGNIYIHGGGDPSLGSRYFNKEGQEKAFLLAWVDSIKQRGIKEINGSIVADGSDFEYMGAPDGWTWGDLGNYFGSGHSGICIYDNILRYYFSTGSVKGNKTTLIKTSPKVPDLIFHNYITSGQVSGDNSFIYGAPYSLDRFARGELPLNQTMFEVRGSLPDPEWQLAYEVTETLKANGIRVSGNPLSVRKENKSGSIDYPTLQHLWTHKGKKLIDVAALANMRSVNLFAEALVAWIGYIKTGKGSTTAGINQMEIFWKNKIPMSGLYLQDGSGLSRSNAISASHFCKLLESMTTSKSYSSFYNTLPVSGKSGTLSNLCKDEPGHGRIVAKSGTMGRIKSYAGYINSKSGKKMAFAIIVNNYSSSSSTVTRKIEKLLNTLAVY